MVRETQKKRWKINYPNTHQARKEKESSLRHKVSPEVHKIRSADTSEQLVSSGRGRRRVLESLG